jgi:putative ABC transport system permease protein
MREPRHSRLVRAAVACYRRSLRLFPAPFRDRFDAELIEAFAGSIDEAARERGIRGVTLTIGRALADVLRHAAGERWAAWRGMAPGLAISASSDLTSLVDDPHAPHKAGPMDAIIQDIRFSLRMLARTPTLTAAVVLTIALGIGATTSIFTVVDRIVLRPLPFPQSERVAVLCETSPRVKGFCVASPANVADWARSVPALDNAGVARGESFVAEVDGASFGGPGGITSPGFFKTLGIQPALGRLFEDTDLDPARNHVIVVSDGFWRQRLGSRPDAVGRDLTLDNRAFRVIGVLPAGVYIPTYDFVQVWKPLTASIDDTSDRTWRGFMALGRLARGATKSDLDAQIKVVRAQLAAAYPDANANWGVRTASLRREIAGDVSTTLWMFLGAVGFVLLIACANVANLLLVRAAGRAPEFALRASLGAGRARLIRQVLTESLVLAAIGGIGGWLLALFATRLLVSLAPGDIPRLEEVTVDGRMAWFTCALTMGAALLFGLVPARDAARRSLAEALKMSRVTDRGGARAQAVLVVAELTLAMVLLVGAAGLTRAFSRLVSWQPGFDRSGVTVTWMSASPGNYKTTRNAVDALQRVREQVAGIPGIADVGLGSAGPLFGGVESGALSIGGERPLDPDHAPAVYWFDADPHYFDALGRRIVRGRGLGAADVDGAPNVAVVNESFAQQFFPHSEPLGRLVTVQEHASTIVGVVSDVRPTRPDRDTPPEIFWPIRQYPRFGAYLVMRVAPTAGALEWALKARVAAIDPNIQVNKLAPLDQMFEHTLVSPRFTMTLILIFAAVAITLAAIGVYGVVAHTVASRTREIGLRVALGATPARLFREVIGRLIRLALASLVMGVGIALVLGRALEGLLYGVAITDVLSLAACIGVFLAVTLLAGFFPARLATRVDPIVALRAE